MEISAFIFNIFDDALSMKPPGLILFLFFFFMNIKFSLLKFVSMDEKLLVCFG